MKMLFSFFVVFAITVVGTIGFMKPELLKSLIEAEDTVMLTEAEWNEQKLQTVKEKAKRAKNRASTSGTQPGEDDFDDFMGVYGSQRGEMASQILPAPALNVSGWENSIPLSIASLRGKIVVLKFWATWCGPCKDAMPYTNELLDEYGNKGVVFIGVCTSSGNERMSEVAAANGVRYPIVKDNQKKTLGAYKIKSYPSYVVIDANGNVRFPKCKKREVEGSIKYLLREQSK